MLELRQAVAPFRATAIHGLREIAVAWGCVIRLPLLRPGSAERRKRNGGGSAVAGGSECLLQRRDEHAAHEAGLAETHLGLGRMDVDIDHIRGQVYEQRHDRIAVMGQEILIRASHRAQQYLVAHRPPVDEKILLRRCATVEGRQACKPGEAEFCSRATSMGRLLSVKSRPEWRKAAPCAHPSARPARRQSGRASCRRW